MKAFWIVGGVAVAVIAIVQGLQNPAHNTATAAAVSNVEYDTVRHLAEPALERALKGAGYAEGVAGCWVASPRATCTMLSHSSMFQSAAFATLAKSGDDWTVTGTHLCRKATCDASEFGEALHR